MKSWIDDYLEYTSSQESPPLFHKWCGLSIIASVLNRRVWLDRRDPRGIVYFTNYPGQLSVCLVAGAGRCKKSTAIGLASPFMKAANVKLFDGKITPEGLIDELISGGSPPIMTIVASEMEVFLTKASYNDGMIGLLMKLIDCESNDYKKSGGKTKITNPCLTLLMGTTPFSMGKSIPPAAHGVGFLSRHVFVYSDKPGGAQPLTANVGDIDPVNLYRAATDQTNLVLYLGSLSRLAGPFEWTTKAQQWFNNYYTNYRNSIASEGEGYAQRRPDHLARVAMCLQVAHKPSLLLDEWALAMADQWLTEIELEMPRAFAFIGQHANSELQERILKVFREQPMNGAGRLPLDGKTLWYRVNRYFGGDLQMMSRQMASLLQAGIIECISTNPNVYKFIKEPY